MPGDIVLLEAGDKVPANLRLIEVAGMTVEEAILTGKSVPVRRAVKSVELNAALGDQGINGVRRHDGVRRLGHGCRDRDRQSNGDRTHQWSLMVPQFGGHLC